MLINKKIEILAAAPDLLEELISEVPEEIRKVRRIKGKWSIHEHACHLAEPGTTVPDDNLAKMDLQEQLADFRKNRLVMIDILKNYTSEDWHNEGSHPEYTSINPLLWLRHVLMHDHFHMYRIEELLLTTEEYLRKP